MRIAAGWIAALLLVACTEEAPVDPSPITRVPPTPVVAPPPPPPLPPPVPVEPAAPEVPDDAALSAGFRLYQRDVNGFGPYERHVLVEGDFNGATLTVVEIHGRNRKGELFARHRLGKDDVQKLVSAIDEAKWWTLGDEDESRWTTDSTSHLLSIRRGGFSHTIKVDAGCACPQGRGCDCPQLTLMKLISRWDAKLAASTRVKLPAPRIERFKAPLPAETGEPVDCETGPGGLLACEGDRCFPKGNKQVACFSSPFDEGQRMRVRRTTAAAPVHKTSPTYAWAFETEDGRRCEGRPLPEAQDSIWACRTGGPGGSHVRWVVKAGGGQVAVMLSDDDGFDISPITVIWP